MDERDGILRVVTGTEKGRYPAAALVGQNNAGFVSSPNANLYCVSLAADGWQVVGQDIGFAPDGETLQSVRFNGQYAYVCTAVTVTLNDPVYFFDLSDPRALSGRTPAPSRASRTRWCSCRTEICWVLAWAKREVPSRRRCTQRAR